MAKITVTEARAELKTIGKRVQKKKQVVMAHLVRLDRIIDPLAEEGGSEAAVAEARQGIQDLLGRIVEIRAAIQKSNLYTELTIEGETKTVAEWLTWRKEAAPLAKNLLDDIAVGIDSGDRQLRTVHDQNPDQENQPALVVNVSRKELAEQREKMETILGTLDGKLSLLNATTHIELRD